jgi:glycosyltransferase involved in cell wall biosynthesis
MKVLFINNFNYLRGGSEKVFFDEKAMLLKNNHEAAVFSRANGNNEQSEFVDYFPQAMDTGQLGLSLRTFSTVKELIYSRSARDGIGETVQRFAPDIAHAHNIYGRLSTSVLDELKEREIPTVLTLHDLKLLCPSYLMLSHGEVCEKCKGSKFYRAISEKCHKNSLMASAVYAVETWFNHFFRKYDSVKYLIAPSKFIRDKFIEYGWDPARVVYLPNFIDATAIEPSIGTGDYLLYIGRLSREKGVQTLLKALQQIKIPTALKIVGDGPERQQLESIASSSNIPVQFTGYLTGIELQQAVANAKAVIMPSEWYENAPLSLLEAFAYGKPVIGAAIGGIPEMIDDGMNGYLFTPGDINELKESIERILSISDDALYSMGRYAREKVEREFTPERHYSGLIDIYSRAMRL